MRQAYKHMPLVSVWTAVLYFLASVSAPLFLLFRLFHFKPALRFRIPFFAVELTAFRLHFLPLQLERLLGFRADPASLRLLSDVPEPPFGIVCDLSHFCFYSRAENQFVIMPQDKFPYVIILGLCAKGHFADGKFSIIHTLKDANPEGIFKE